MVRLTGRQALILAYCKECTINHGRFPTVREVAESIGIKSHRAIEGHILALDTKGYIVNSAEKGPPRWKVTRDLDGCPVELRYIRVE